MMGFENLGGVEKKVGLVFLLAVGFIVLFVPFVRGECLELGDFSVGGFVGSNTLKVVGGWDGVFLVDGTRVSSWSDGGAVYFVNMNVSSYVLGRGCGVVGDEGVFYRFGFGGWHAENPVDSCVVSGGVLKETSVSGSPCVSPLLSLGNEQLKSLFVEGLVKHGSKDVGFGTRSFNEVDGLWRSQAYADVRDVGVCSFHRVGGFDSFNSVSSGWVKVTLFADHSNKDSVVSYWINDVKQGYSGILLNENNAGSGVMRMDCNSGSECEGKDFKVWLMNPGFVSSYLGVHVGGFVGGNPTPVPVPVVNVSGNTSVVDVENLFSSFFDRLFKDLKVKSGHVCYLRGDYGCLVSGNDTCRTFYGTTKELTIC